MKKLFFIASVGLLFSCNTPDCTNGEQDGNETGIDCGGDCPPCQNNNTNNTNNAHLNPNLTYGNVTDIDGNEYATIQIGTQIWMAENLNTTKYCNGDPIPHVTDVNLTNGDGAHNNNNNPYGKLYNWYAVDDSRNICPCNWHVPTYKEWTVLTDYLGGEGVAGGKMKSTGTQYWNSPNTGATNESGFSGLPGGSISGNGSFYSVGDYGYWWSSSQDVTGGALYRFLYYDYAAVDEGSVGKGLLFSVRCIKD
jgi:uncharacterized protein (TIGR02145 family)